MFYSLLTLNPRSRQVQREIGAFYEMHRTLLGAFPQGKVGVARADPEATDVLFRLDSMADGTLMLLVQSRTEPDWSVLGPGYLLDTPRVKQRDLQLQIGQLFSFRLRANPTKRLSAGKGNTGKRVGIYDEGDQLAWLTRKGEQHGFCARQVQVSRDGKIKCEKKVKRPDTNLDIREMAEKARSDSPKEAYKLEMLSVQFDGILQVVDPDKVLSAVQTGIGTGKGFGFGLLSLAPAPAWF